MERGKRPGGPPGPGSGAPGGPPRKRGPAYDDDDAIDDFLADQDDDQMELMQPPDEAEDVDLGEAGRNWVRPAVADFDPATTSVGGQGPGGVGGEREGGQRSEGRGRPCHAVPCCAVPAAART
jgi:hypothetical protein